MFKYQLSYEVDMVKVGIIGGSGLDNPDILENGIDINVETKYGKPSSPLKTGKISGVDVVLLARHGRNHEIPPSQVNFRANVLALKEAGCDFIIATTAVGSLKEEINRGDLVIIDQFIDFTRHRKVSFFEDFNDGPKHTAMAEPFSSKLRNILISGCDSLGLKHHKKGTVVTIEGPRFSTKAESHMFRSFGADVINMSIAPEAVLCNELEIPYATIAMSTDYDCWKDDEKPVSWDEILKVFKNNIEKVIKLLVYAIPKMTDDNLEKFLKSKIGTYENWPEPGITFRDINPLLNDAEALQVLNNTLLNKYKGKDFDVAIGIESRGYVPATMLAVGLKKRFVPIRKSSGKLPGETEHIDYTTEYSSGGFKMQKELIKPGDKAIIFDDLGATGGSAKAAADLAKMCGAEIVGVEVFIDLKGVGARELLESSGYTYSSVIVC